MNNTSPQPADVYRDEHGRIWSIRQGPTGLYLYLESEQGWREWAQPELARWMTKIGPMPEGEAE